MNRRISTALLSVLVLGSLASASAVQAYGLLPGRWSGDPVVIRIDPSGLQATEHVSEDEWRAALTGAARIWNDAAADMGAPVQLTISSENAAVRIVVTDDSSIEIGDHVLNGLFPAPLCQPHCSNATTLPYMCDDLRCAVVSDGPARTVDGAVLVLRRSAPWRVQHESENGDDLDAESTLLHELGHLLGLDHSGRAFPNEDCSAVMFGGPGCGNSGYKGSDGHTHLGAFYRRELALDDVCGLAAIYGVACASEVAGVVLGRQGPIIGATVTFHGTGGATRSVQTNDQGMYLFTSMPPGHARITATAQSFDDGAVELEVSAAQQYLAPDLHLTAPEVQEGPSGFLVPAPAGDEVEEAYVGCSIVGRCINPYRVDLRFWDGWWYGSEQLIAPASGTPTRLETIGYDRCLRIALDDGHRLTLCSFAADGFRQELLGRHVTQGELLGKADSRGAVLMLDEGTDDKPLPFAGPYAIQRMDFVPAAPRAGGGRAYSRWPDFPFASRNQPRGAD